MLSLVVSLLILLIGARAMYGLQIRQYPEAVEHDDHGHDDLSRRLAQDLIEGFITTPIEQAVATAEGIDYLTSNSVLSTSTITACTSSSITTRAPRSPTSSPRCSRSNT